MPICPGWRVNPPWGQWLISGGAEGEEPPDDAKRLHEIYVEFVAEPDAQKRFELETEMYAIHNRNLWIIGVLKAPADLPTTWYALLLGPYVQYPEARCRRVLLLCPGDVGLTF